MGRKYVRDKAGRFAPKGGGSKGKGGKMGKSAKNVKARAAYKKASGNLRSMKKISGGAKDAKDRKFWNRSLGGAKSGMTRVTNRLTKKGAAKAKTSSKKQYASEQSKKYAAARKAPKRSQSRREAVASAQIKKGAKARASYKPKQEAKQARERILKKTKAKRMEKGGFKTPKGKMSKTKTTAVSKAYYKKLSGNARKNFRIGDANRGKSPSEIRGKHDSARGRKKRKGAKTYDNSTNQMFKSRKLKRDLKRKYKYGL